MLVWPELLFHTLTELGRHYGDRVRLMVQTNGDLLDEALLDRLLEHRVCRISVASMDRYHAKSTLKRHDYLERLFRSRGMEEAKTPGANVGVPPIGGSSSAPEPPKGGTPTPGSPPMYAFWGATEGSWIGPLWPRGRAMQKKLSRAGPEHRFCSEWSGARGFLDYRSPGSEVNVQLADVYPCCPTTCRPIGSLLEEPLLAMLDRCAREPVFQALNEGRPEAMGVSRGISEEEGFRRSAELGNHCLWCDEFFLKFAQDLLRSGPTQRDNRDLLTLGWRGQ